MLKNSAVLDFLIRRAREVGSRPSEAVDAERFIVAVCDLIDGTVSFDGCDTEERERLARILSRYADTAVVKSRLLDRINTQKRFLLSEQLFEIALFDARSSAERKNGTCVASCDVLEGLITLAPDEVLDALSVKAPERAKTDAPAPVRKNDRRGDLAVLTEKVKRVREALLSSLYGQENAVSVFVNGYFQAELLALTDKARVRPRATFLFAGPPGVGKTLLAEKAAGLLDLPFMRFDMSEYSGHDAATEFCGSDKVYENGKPGNVTGFAEAHPKCVLLFDEIEKASLGVIHLFLQILDAGRIRDNYSDREVLFTDAILIFTTNAGKQLYTQSDDYADLSRKVVLKAIRSDVNPVTNVPYFPAALCSRFASGNVVMFNHIHAHDLIRIARREIRRRAKNFENEIGISVEIDESVYAAILFAEGGSADGRMIRSRSESFFDNELFELFRLVSTDNAPGGIGDLEKIRIGVSLPKNDPRILSLFGAEGRNKVLVFSTGEVASLCAAKAPDCTIVSAHTVRDAEKRLRDGDVKAVLIDFGFDRRSPLSGYLNAEDVRSASRDFYRLIRTKYRDVPVYLLRTDGSSLTDEEISSFFRSGVRGELFLSTSRDTFGRDLYAVCADIHCQNSMNYLAKYNKVLSYETAQSVSAKGKTAKITLFDFTLRTAVEAEDSQDVLGSVSRPSVRFDDVIGAEEAKKELRYFSDYLKNPKKYARTGVRIPKGILLYGPPGTGKTMLAKAMAAESDVTFLTAEGNLFVKSYVGEGKDKLHELFRTARKYAPAVLFIDEIDAVARERRGGEHANANGEDVLTAFLAEMDGFHSDPSKPVFVLAATNYDVRPGRAKSLDPAVVRRFDRTLCIDLPNKEERIRFLRGAVLANKAFSADEDEIENLAVRSTGMSLADLGSVLESALRSSVREDRPTVSVEALEEAFESFSGGEAKKWDAATLRRVARHEAGHAYLCWESGETPSYLTIVSRGDRGGYMRFGGEEKAVYTKDELLADIRIALGGRACEVVYYGEKDGISTGASDDLASATRLARQIVCSYGMESSLGLAVIDPAAAETGELAAEVRRAVNGILDEQMKRATDLLLRGRPAVDRLVEALLSESHLSGKEIDRILREG